MQLLCIWCCGCLWPTWVRFQLFFIFFFFQAEDGIRDVERSRGLGDVYKRQYQRRVHGDMIKAMIIMNSSGKLRLLRMYDDFIEEKDEEALIAELYSKAVMRKPNSSNFIVEKVVLKDAYTVVCRQYATLIFMLICDENENELALLDFIHIFVEVLDKLFADVCELDILYNPEKINFILDELIVDGNVVQTSLKEAVENLNLMAKSEAAS
eukprot:TRINITY_DN12081_c0_g1_i1.p1 TRINITY_DN12081_c0_g1~~TRINITY_DN12081_c0_g1_i1.p1  ORF type:complete len:210 (-),score=48.70 TRINITY_DN12081_c0_g1_i1:43-672(-)